MNYSGWSKEINLEFRITFTVSFLITNAAAAFRYQLCFN